MIVRWKRVANLACTLLFAGCAASMTPPQEPQDGVPFGGGYGLSLGSPEAPPCPPSVPSRLVVGGQVVCTSAGVDVDRVTRRECATLGIDCDALFGCEPMVIEDCETTLSTADCPGRGAPVLACDPDLDDWSWEPRLSLLQCFWFTHGCVPAGFVRSECEADDACCLAGPWTDSTSPFDPSDQDMQLQVGPLLEQFGTSYVDLDRGFDLQVVHAEPDNAEEASVTLYPDHGEPQKQPWVRRDGREGAWWVGRVEEGSFGISIETRVQADGSLVARACPSSSSDTATNSCSEEHPGVSGCGTSGTLTLGESHARAELETTQGRWVVEFDR